MFFVVSIILSLVLTGVLLWLVNAYVPMDGKMKKALNIVTGAVVIGWLLYATGISDSAAGLIASGMK